ncbi:MAG TPA: glycosyltransferase [Jatrophihabitans sp.]|nr:glycosyltransferase [Jatrophihabitans sp.]
MSVVGLPGRVFAGTRTAPADPSLPAAASRSNRFAAWADQLDSPVAETDRSRRLAHVGALAAIGSLLAYLVWRAACTVPTGGWNQIAAWTLIGFEALPLVGLAAKTVTLWTIDSLGPPQHDIPAGMRVVVLIPTYNEPAEVLAPTVAAACALQPAHETWVLDDGDRGWVAEMAESFGARYICRPVHDHAKAGNLNYALDVMALEESAGEEAVDVVAVLDCDHVPLPTFLTATLGWFADENIALVQGPQAFYNAGAFDDDGVCGEQGLFFNVLMRARHRAGAGPFWCGSTSLLRVRALREVGGVATETITEDLHTTLKLIKNGWNTAYHHQTLAVGLAPATPEQYLLQRRRWGLGAMQIVTHERLWAAKRWMSWRNFHEYLTGTLWWLEGVATLVAFLVPAVILLSGATISTAGPLAFATAFTAMFALRLWGSKRLLRGQIHWPTAFALRILRVPVGVACLWWLLTRNHLDFQVTPKAAADGRHRGRVPRVLWLVMGLAGVVVGYAAAVVVGLTPWHPPVGSTVAAGMWVVFATAVLVYGARRIHAAQYATSRRNGYRVEVDAPARVDGAPGRLLDVSVGGAAVLLPEGPLTGTGRMVDVELPGVPSIRMCFVRSSEQNGLCVASLRVADGDWAAYRALSLWMFHTPADALPGLPQGVPAVALVPARA